MAVYFVIGGVLVAWALILTFGGMARIRDFPDRGRGRLLMTVSACLALGVFVALLATTEKEHPREEAKAEAAEKAKEKAPASGAEASAIAVSEVEYKINLSGGTTLKPGKSTFDVKNDGKIQHDLAVEGAGGEKKTDLIDAGKTATLDVDLEPGKYKLYCTVPGHEQLGMKTEVTVRQ